MAASFGASFAPKRDGGGAGVFFVAATTASGERRAARDLLCTRTAAPLKVLVASMAAMSTRELPEKQARAA